MKDTAPVAETLIPPALSKRAGNNNKGPGPVQTASHEVRTAAGSLPFLLTPSQ